MSWWCSGSILVAFRKGGWVAGSSHFTVMTYIFDTKSSGKVSKVIQNVFTLSTLNSFSNLSPQVEHLICYTESNVNKSQTCETKVKGNPPLGAIGLALIIKKIKKKHFSR